MEWVGHKSTNGRGEKFIQILKERDHLKEVGTDGKAILQWMQHRKGSRAWTGFLWFTVKTSGVLLCAR
jgi:hypothetical protein